MDITKVTGSIYNATVSPSDRSYETVNDSPDAITLSWEMTTTPVDVSGKKPTSTIVIDTTKLDAKGKTNLAIQDVGGNLLLVSQFTLYADCRKGNRPSFIRSGSAEHAEKLYDYIVDKCKAALGEERIGTGIFGASMKCSLVNEGPFTIILDSEEICR